MKAKFILFICIYYFNISFAQDYSWFVNKYFDNSRNDNLKESIQELLETKEKEHLLIDLKELVDEADEFSTKRSQELKEIDEDFSQEHPNPSNQPNCEQLTYYRNKFESERKRVSSLTSMVNLAKTSLETCLNNPYGSGDCSKQRNNYNRQVSLYKEAASNVEFYKKKGQYYEDECQYEHDRYKEAYKKYRLFRENKVKSYQQRQQQINQKHKNLESELLELVNSSPLNYKLFNTDGSLLADGKLVLNKGKMGKWTDYFENGKIKKISEYVNDELHGPVIEYFENGNIKYKGTYWEGNKYLKWEFYYENGVLRAILNHDKQGLKQGETLFYYENGNLQFEGYFKDDEKVGRWKDYNEEGELIRDEIR